MALARIFSIATVGALALCAACSSAGSRDAKTPPAPELTAPDAGAHTTTRVSPAEVAPPIEPPQPVLETGVVVGASELDAPRAAPLLALNQMVTAQALLISMFLAPVSPGGAETIAHAETPSGRR